VATAAPLVAFTGKCVGVTDGDTVKVMLGGRAATIRLVGIDAPEKKQAFGEVSKQALSQMAFGKNLTVYPTGHDRYGRTLGWVFVGRSNLNSAQVQNGYAWWYRQYSPKETKIAALEAAARAGRVGLWRAAAPVAPWAWRKR
jgi:endonuclease YncB( thermonuclease family)